MASVDIPPYLNRHKFIPRKPKDFGDGGAFPEIGTLQYPLGMGDNDSNLGDNMLLVAYDLIAKQNENASKIVYSRYGDIIPKILKDGDEDEDEEDLEKGIVETMEATKAVIDEVLNEKLNVSKQSCEDKYIKYHPSEQSVEFNSGAKERVIRLVEMPVDPLEPPKFKHKRVPKGSGSPPVPVMHSPPRALSVKDLEDARIPPCISNWKNQKGYVIPLDKRLAADGRGLEEVRINDGFAKFSEALYVAEEKARQVVGMRAKERKELALKEKEKRERDLLALAAEAISTARDYRKMEEKTEETLERDMIRGETGRERKRERRLETKNDSTRKKSKAIRDKDRDISENVALGMATVGSGSGSGSGSGMYDERLFNQEKGMNSGFATDDQYNVYDKGLFAAQATLSTLYQPKKDLDADVYGTSDKRALRDKPVEFETDPFGLEQWLSEVKAKKDVDKAGTGGTMRASGDSSREEGYDGVSRRSRVNFEKGKPEN